MHYDLELFGKAVCKIRNNLGYTQKDVSELTTITIETMRKIENGKVIPKQVTLELLSSVLKDDLNQMLLNYRLSNYKEFYKAKHKIEYKLETGNYDDLAKDLDTLNEILDNGNLNNYMYKLIKQLNLLIESIILKINKNDYNSSLNKLIDSIKVTTPLFELDKYNEFVFSSLEIRILMNIALLINRLESIYKCEEILLFCIETLNPEKIEFKLRILYNLSYTYHRKDLHDKALYYANEGIKTCIENNSLSCLALLYSRKGIAEYFLKNKNYKISLINAKTLFEITKQDILIEMLTKFCKKHEIEIA